MKTILYVCLLGLLTVIIACETEGIVLGEDYELQLGETVNFQAGNFDIRFDEVLEDSRCPIGVECGWEGRAIIKLLIAEGSDSTDIQLITYNSINLDSMLTVEYQDYLIELIEVNPYPHIDSTSMEYSVIFNLSEL